MKTRAASFFAGVILAPEPSTYALGALALAGLWLIRRKNKGKV